MGTYPLRYIARVTIEFTSPFIIGGENDFFADDAFMADVNGLPTLPGTSIAGVLRHEFEKCAGLEATDAFFGWQKRDNGSGSRLSVSCGCVHNKNNKPVEGILFGNELCVDDVLKQAATGTVRDHVRMTHRGTAAQTGKFDEKCISAGHRFTFELLLEGNQEDAEQWQALLNLLTQATMRLGGKTRRGFGAFEVITIVKNTFDLSTESGFNCFANYPVSLAATISGGVKPPRGDKALTATITLNPEGFWMFGGGSGGGDADMHPVKETRISWQECGDKTQGTVKNSSYYLPGSSIKGALSHRTAFHYNVLKGLFANGKSATELAEIADNNQAVQNLFGFSKTDRADQAGQRGRVLIHDVYFEHGQPKIVNHVSIDRFTGGSRAGFLFAEKPLYKGTSLKVELVVAEQDSIDHGSRVALQRALEDLVKGRLALGAGAGRGNGFFSGAIKWNDNGVWIGGGA